MGKFITVHGERAQNFKKKEQPKKWKQLMRGGLETTRAEASNAEACHAEATNNYTHLTHSYFVNSLRNRFQFFKHIYINWLMFTLFKTGLA